MEFKDYYQTLGVGRSAEPDEIKRSYRRLARKYHPDVSKEPEAEQRFKEIQEAHEVLKDPEKRAAYDQFGANWKAGQPSGCLPRRPSRLARSSTRRPTGSPALTSLAAATRMPAISAISLNHCSAVPDIGAPAADIPTSA